MPVVERVVEAFLSNEDSPDILNPIHSTVGARRAGFRAPLVASNTVWGWATDAVIEALGEEWLDHGWSEFSLRQPTYPHYRLVVRVAPTGEGSAHAVTLANEAGVVCVAGAVGLGEASWADDLVVPARMTPEEAPEDLPPIVLGETAVGGDWRPVRDSTEFGLMAEQLVRHHAAPSPLFLGLDAPLHPAWLVGRAEHLLRHNVSVPQTVHTRSLVQHRHRGTTGVDVVTGGRLLGLYEEDGHHVANFDCLVSTEAGLPLVQMRHWTIVRVASDRPLRLEDTSADAGTGAV